MTVASKCGHCGVTFPPGYGPTQTVTLAATFPVEKYYFCDELCAGRWALVEVPRLRGWLSRIVARTRGAASGLASQALTSSSNIGGAPSTRKPGGS